MINSLTNAGELVALRRVLGDDGNTGDPANHDTFEVALYFDDGNTPNPNGTTGFTAEVSTVGTGYTRESVVFGDAVTVGGVTSAKNTAAVTFGPALIDWEGGVGTGADANKIKYMAIWNTTLTTPTMIWYGELKDSNDVATSKLVNIDDQLVFAIDKIVLSMD